MDFVSRANKVKVDPALMLQVIQHTGFTHDDPSIAQDQMGAIVRALQNVDLADDARSMAAASISFRLEALTALILTARKHNWPVPKVRGGTITAEALTRCASEEALTIYKGRPAFDPESFAKRLQALSK
jgi:hypothetical protein